MCEKRIVGWMALVLLPGMVWCADGGVAAYLNPAADLAVYINTKQAEKAMDKALWKRIEKDKQAIKADEDDDEDGDDPFSFDTKGRDLELALNLTFLSYSPLSVQVEAVGSVTGGKGMSVIKDLDKLAKQFQTDDDTCPVKRIALGKTQGWTFSQPMTEETPAFKIDAFALDAARFHIRARLNPDAAAAGAAPQLIAAPSAPVKGAAGASFLVNADVQKLIAFAKSAPDVNKDMLASLETVRRLSVRGEVQGKNLQFTMDAVCLSENAALENEKALEPLIQLFGEQTGKPGILLAGGAVKREGPVLKISGAVNIEAGWNYMSLLSGGGMKPPKNRKPKVQQRRTK